MAQSTEAIAAAATAYDDWRFASRQDSLRNERVLGEMSQSLARNTQANAPISSSPRAKRSSRRCGGSSTASRVPTGPSRRPG